MIKIHSVLHSHDLTPFRTNWWFHVCSADTYQGRWIHKQYHSCDACGEYGSSGSLKGVHPL